MKAKAHLLIIPTLLLGVLLALLWVMRGAGERNVPASKAVQELNQGGPGRSWRVESALGRDIVHLFRQGQGCYLSRTLAPR